MLREVYWSVARRTVNVYNGELNIGKAGQIVLLVALTALCVPTIGEERITVIDVARFNTSGMGDSVYLIAVMAESGWDPEDITSATKQVRSTFDQCQVAIDALAVYRLRVPARFHELDEADQGELLAALPDHRPLIAFVDQTKAGDTAYSYLESAPVASRGTAWITRRAPPACVGVLLAHELGHILLDTAQHSSDNGNLMSYTCVHSNVERSRSGTALSARQCEQLRRKYGVAHGLDNDLQP